MVKDPSERRTGEINYLCGEDSEFLTFVHVDEEHPVKNCAFFPKKSSPNHLASMAN
jgi:hypothetical protein